MKGMVFLSASFPSGEHLSTYLHVIAAGATFWKFPTQNNVWWSERRQQAVFSQFLFSVRLKTKIKGYSMFFLFFPFKTVLTFFGGGGEA